LITLSLDTATPTPGIALVRDGHTVVERRVGAQPGAGRRVAEELHLLLEEGDLGLNEVDRIVVGVGPGGFTGLRIGIATAMGLGQALDRPVLGVCSLETLALGMAPCLDGHEVAVPAIDARRGEVFTGVYRPAGAGRLVEVIAPRAVAVEDFPALLDEAGPAVVAGDGDARVADRLGATARIVDDPEVRAIRPSLAVSRVDAGGARPVTPMYLRLPDAEVNRLRRASASR